MNSYNRTWAAALAVAVVTGCASVGGASTFREDVGTATEPDATTVMERVAGQFHYQVNRREEPPNFWIETHWQVRPPFEDERELGVIHAETRLTLRGRQRVDTLLGSHFAMSLLVENRTRTADDPAWVETRNTLMFEAYAKSIADRLEQELRTIGVRRFH